VVVSGAVAAAFAPLEVEQDARLVVPLAAEPELEQAVLQAAHSVARGALRACPQDDSVAVRSAASPVVLLVAPLVPVARVVAHSVA
jgi:hypothetical protein